MAGHGTGTRTEKSRRFVLRRRCMKKWILPLLVCLFATGCDQFTWFQSEGSVRKKLSGTWKRQFLEIVDYEENWIFQDGKVNIRQIGSQGAVDVDEADYEVSTSLFSAFVTLNGFDADTSLLLYNQKWTIIDLDKKILYIVADIDAGLIQREFVKKE
jgi:hypothetical protein